MKGVNMETTVISLSEATYTDVIAFGTSLSGTGNAGLVNNYYASYLGYLDSGDSTNFVNTYGSYFESWQGVEGYATLTPASSNWSTFAEIIAPLNNSGLNS